MRPYGYLQRERFQCACHTLIIFSFISIIIPKDLKVARGAQRCPLLQADFRKDPPVCLHSLRTGERNMRELMWSPSSLERWASEIVLGGSISLCGYAARCPPRNHEFTEIRDPKGPSVSNKFDVFFGYAIAGQVVKVLYPPESNAYSSRTFSSKRFFVSDGSKMV